jgi:hypothetical protein
MITMSSTSTGHTRNVAGHKLTQITKYAYEQALANGKRRWYIKFKKSDGKGYIWKVTRAFKDKAQYINQKPYRTLTDAVLAANK